MITSTCLHIEESNFSRQALKLLLASESVKSKVEVLKVIINLSDLGREFVSVDDVLQHTSLSKSSVSSVFTYLSKHHWFLSTKAKERTEAHSATKLIYFKPLSERESLEPSTKTPRVQRVEAIDRSIPHEPLEYSDIDSSQIALPYTHTFSSLTAPGRETVYEMHSVNRTHTGEAYVNKVTSAVGVVNDYAHRVRQILLQLSYYQITQNIQWHSDNPNVNPRFMIRMIDIIKAGQFSNGERKHISEAIDQNRQSIYTIRNNPLVADDKVLTDQFSFLTFVQGISAKEGGLEDSQHPYIAVTLEWDAAVIGYLKKNSIHFIQSKEIATLPSLFNRLYQKLRVAYFSKRNALYADIFSELFHNEALTLHRLVEITWENVHESTYHRTLVKNLLGELKLKAIEALYQQRETVGRMDIVEIDLHGFIIVFKIANFQNTRSSSNLSSLVHISVDEKKVIEATGAQYNFSAKNLPTKKNELRDLFIEEPQRYRHVMPDRIKKLDNLFNFKNARSDYYLKFTVQAIGQEYLITRYHDQTELEMLYSSIATMLSIPHSDIHLYFDAKVRRLKLYNHLQIHEFQEALQITGLHKTELLNILINNLRAIPRMKKEQWNNIGEFVQE